MSQGELARLAVICETLGGVVEGKAVGDDVVGSSDITGITTTKLEAIAITLEVGETPAVDAVAPSKSVLDGNSRLELPMTLVR